MDSGLPATEILPTEDTAPPRDHHRTDTSLVRAWLGATAYGDDRPPRPVVDRERPSVPRGRVALTVEGMPDLFQCRPDRATGHRPPRRLSLGLSAGLALGLSLGLPASCAGCGRWETTLCPQCRELLEGEPFSVEHADAAGDLDVLALATYTGPIRAMVLGWKNGSREDLAEAMARAGRRLGRYWAHAHPPAEVWAGPPGDRPGCHPVSGRGRSTTPAAPVLLVVPAPSRMARRLRGRLVAAHLADAVAQGIAERWAHRERTGGSSLAPTSSEPLQSPPPTRTNSPPPLILSTDLLRRRGGGAHQAGRSSRQRRGNRATAPRLLTPVTGLPALLVDDVATTGATLGACARALEGAGGRVLGALVLAAAPPPARASVMVPVRTTSRSLPRRPAPSRLGANRLPPIVPVPAEPPRSPSSPR